MVRAKVRQPWTPNPMYVEFEDVVTFLDDYRVADAHNSARAVWRSLILFFPGRLIVECELCGQPYGTCVCEVQGKTVGSRQAYFIAGARNSCSLDAVRHWRITRASLQTLDLGEIRRNMGIPTIGKWRVVAFVEWIRQR